MSLPNGIRKSRSPSIPPSSLPTPGKRKRTDSPEKLHVHRILPEKRHRDPQLLQDILYVLNRDSSPELTVYSRDNTYSGLLTEPLPTSEKTTKRARLSSQENTIQSRIDTGYYTSLRELLNDVAVIENSQRSRSEGNDGTETQNTHQVTLMLAKRINQLLLQSDTPHTSGAFEDDVKDAQANGDADTETRENRTVLTFLGNSDRGPKQLFSSLQQPLLTRKNPPTYSEIDEITLPIGISATHALPFNPPVSEKKKEDVPKIGDLFKSSQSVKALDPPKQSKNLTRSSNFTWGQEADNLPQSRGGPLEKDKAREKDRQLPSGQWVHLNDTSPSSLPSSPEEKRRQRDRALSFSDSKADLDRGGERYDQQISRDKALFQSAYSSFIPTEDTADTVISEQTKNRIWWDRTGQRRFSNLLSTTYPDDGLDGPSDLPTPAEIELSAKGFEEAVAAYVLEDPPPEFASEPTVNSEKEVEDILREISDLLSTMSSHQRNRNLSTTSTSRASMGDLSKMTGSPSEPSSAEFDMYEVLKSQLSTIISSLPPHIVAKLDGEKLNMLNVRSSILVDSPSYKGTMEKDDLTRQREQAMRATNSSTPRLNPPATTTPRANYQALNAAMYSAKGYSSNARSTSATPNYQPPNAYRQPNQYTSLAASYPNRTPSTTPRPNYSSYGQGSTPQYSQTPTLQQFQRPTQNGYGTSYGTQHPSTYQRPNSQHLQRPDEGAYPYSSSPQKPTVEPTYPPKSSHQQPSYLSRGPHIGSYGTGTSSKESYPTMKPASNTPQTPNGQQDASGPGILDGSNQESAAIATNGT
ncbi:MAG: hypothetical protein Q9227_005124 [Pyrenula ochraceoflavens]